MFLRLVVPMVTCLLLVNCVTKYRAENEQLTEVPLDIPPDSWLVHLKKNYIEEIPNNVFINLTHCVQLLLHYNSIKTIGLPAFRGLVALETLHLGRNQISEIHQEFWTDLKRLEVLHLWRNLIKDIPDRGFQGLDSLQNLNLNKNQLTLILKNAFFGLTRLLFLQLHSNNIHTIEPGAFSHFTTNLHTNILVVNNPNIAIHRSQFQSPVNDSRFCRDWTQKGLICHVDICWEISGNCTAERGSCEVPGPGE